MYEHRYFFSAFFSLIGQQVSMKTDATLWMCLHPIMERKSKKVYEFGQWLSRNLAQILVLHCPLCLCGASTRLYPLLLFSEAVRGPFLNAQKKRSGRRGEKTTTTGKYVLLLLDAVHGMMVTTHGTDVMDGWKARVGCVIEAFG